MYGRLLVSVSIFLSVCLLPADESWRGPVGAEIDPKLIPVALRAVAHSSRGNFNMFLTWTGSYSVTDRTRYLGEKAKHLTGLARPPIDPAPASIERIEHAVFRFAWDKSQNAVFVAYEKVGDPEFKDLDNGELLHLGSVESADQQSVVRQDAYLYFQPSLRYALPNSMDDVEGLTGRVAYRDDVNEARPLHTDKVLDPRRLFDYGKAIWEYQEDFARAREELNKDPNANVSLRMWQETDPTSLPISYDVLYSARTDQGSGPQINILLTFSPKLSGNLTRVAVQDEHGRKQQLEERSFKLVNKNCFVPERIRTVRYDIQGEINFERVLELKEAAVNESASLDPKQFTVDAFSVKDGDCLIDKLEGTTRVRLNGSWVEVDQFPVAAPRAALAAQSNRNIPWVTMGTVAIALVLAGLFLRARLRAN